MGYTEDYMSKLNNIGMTTTLIGKGVFLEYQSNSEYVLYAIHFPFKANGKHVEVYSKELGQEDVLEYREYFDGKILSFDVIDIKHG